MAFNFSANTGYLWKELPFLDRIRSAKKYGFHSVELHDEAHFEDLGDLKSLLKAEAMSLVPRPLAYQEAKAV